MCVISNPVKNYMNLHLIKPTAKGYKYLGEMIDFYLLDDSLSCKALCEKVASLHSVSNQSVYRNCSYALLNSNIPEATPYTFICEAAGTIEQS